MASQAESLVAPGLALIFDLDGVIIHSNPFHIRAWQTYLEQFGIPYPPERQQAMFGRHNRELVMELIGGNLTEEEIVEHGQRKEAIYRRLVGDAVTQNLVPGLQGLLEELRGTPKAVASNAEELNVRFVLEKASLGPHFQVVLHAGLVDRPKPFPDIYLRAAKELATPPADCIIFEDSASGIEAARQAGARVVGLTTTHATLEGVELAVPDFTAPELRAWLRRQRPRS